jgi:micrococcal nuclease
MNLLKYNFLFLVFFCLSATSVFASNYTGKVVGVIDGDTLEVLHNQHPERIRLSGIDCPEKGQAYGSHAKHAASDLAFGKEVTVQMPALSGSHSHAGSGS